MIPSYRQDLRARAWKNALFWIVVFAFAFFLQLFFQGYYINYSGWIHPTPETKRAFLKPFGIIDIHVLPSPDTILINGKGYVNNSKEIFDIGNYSVAIYKSGYLNPEFPVSITTKNPFYTNIFNLIRTPEYHSTGFDFTRMEQVDSAIFAIADNGTLFVFDRDFQVVRATPLSTRQYLGKGYFADKSSILRYDYVADKFKPIASSDTATGSLSCPDWRVYGDVPYCPSTRQIADHGDLLDTDEVISIANDGVIVTQKYLHNTDTHGSWRHYERLNGKIRGPDSLVHLAKIPFAVQSGSLISLDPTILLSDLIRPNDLGLSAITRTREFGDEVVFIGIRDGRWAFSIFDGEKKWQHGILGDVDVTGLRVESINGAYVFYGKSWAYVYYRWANKIFRILKDPTLALVDGKLFFQKDGKTQVIDLQRK